MPENRAASRAIASINSLAIGKSINADLISFQPPVTPSFTKAFSILMRCCASVSGSGNRKGDFKKSSKANVCAFEATNSNHDANTAAARVVDNFQPVSSETAMCARSSNARTRRATIRSCGMMAICFLPSCIHATTVCAARCASSSRSRASDSANA